MATTSPDNIWTPDAGDDYALTTDLAAMADTVQDALSKRNAYAGTLTERNTFTTSGAVSEGDTWTLTVAPYTVARRRGTAWIEGSPVMNVASASTSSLSQDSIVGTPVDLTGMSVSLTVPVAGNYRFHVVLDTFSSTVADLIAIRLFGLTPVVDWISEANSSSVTFGTSKSHSFEAIRSLAVGTYALKVQCLRVAGSGSVTAIGSTAKPASLTVDRIN